MSEVFTHISLPSFLLRASWVIIFFPISCHYSVAFNVFLYLFMQLMRRKQIKTEARKTRKALKWPEERSIISGVVLRCSAHLPFFAYVNFPQPCFIVPFAFTSLIYFHFPSVSHIHFLIFLYTVSHVHFLFLSFIFVLFCFGADAYVFFFSLSLILRTLIHFFKYFIVVIFFPCVSCSLAFIFYSPFSSISITSSFSCTLVFVSVEFSSIRFFLFFHFPCALLHFLICFLMFLFLFLHFIFLSSSHKCFSVSFQLTYSLHFFFHIHFPSFRFFLRLRLHIHQR